MLNLPTRIEHKIAIHPISVIFMAAIFLRGIERHEKSTGRRPIYKKFYSDGSSECAAACDWLHRARMGSLNWLRRFPRNLPVPSIPSQCRLSTISGFVLNLLAVRPQSKSLVIKMNGLRHFLAMSVSAFTTCLEDVEARALLFHINAHCQQFLCSLLPPGLKVFAY